MDDKNNGEQKSAQFNLDDLEREDGIISRIALNGNRDSQGVLPKSMTAINDNKDYRQELKTGYFTSERKQMQMVLAIEEMRICGIDPTLVIDLLIAQKAGTNGGLLNAIFEALTHQTINTNYTGRRNNGNWWNRGNQSRNNSNTSPIS